MNILEIPVKKELLNKFKEFILDFDVKIINSVELSEDLILFIIDCNDEIFIDKSFEFFQRSNK
jgi:hypothetical protein